MLNSLVAASYPALYTPAFSDRLVSAIAEAPEWQQALFLALFTLLSEDLAAISGGILASVAPANLPYIYLGCWAGAWCGDMIYFLLGYCIGRPALLLPGMRRIISAEKFEIATEWFARRGLYVLTLSRLIPGTRPASFLSAGALRFHPVRFVLISLTLSFLWSGVLILTSMRIGNQLMEWAETLKLGLLSPILSILLILLLLLLASTVPARRWIRAAGPLPLKTSTGKSGSEKPLKK